MDHDYGPDPRVSEDLLDGVYVKTVSTYSAKVHYRKVVCAKYWNVFFGAPHTIKIVNIATAGHPTGDVDGLATLVED